MGVLAELGVNLLKNKPADSSLENEISKQSFLPYGKQSVDDADIAAITEVLKGDWLTQGPTVGKFEKAMAEYCEVKYAVAVGSGTAGLHLAAVAAGLKPGESVITSPISFLASSNCVFYAGGEPLFCDIDLKTRNLDVNKLEEQVKTKKAKGLRGIIPVHFAGYPCDLEEICRIAKQHDLWVIEDAAHAIGTLFNGSPIGSCKYSDMTVFSFHPVKTMTTIEGGLITTNSREFYEKLLLLRSHGMTKDPQLLKQNPGPWYYEMQELGFNYRFSDIQAAMGLSQLNKLDGFVKRRAEIFRQYLDKLSGVPGLELPFFPEGSQVGWHLFSALFDFESWGMTRAEVMLALKERGVGTQVHYIPIYKQPYYQQWAKVDEAAFPNTEKYYSRCLSLPLYPRMTDGDVDRVVRAIKELAPTS